MLCAPAVAGERPLKVVELFTSQSCSSCPPADQLLTDLAVRDDILALGFHVDYWDYLGWQDTFAKPDFAKRQKHYAKRFRHNSVYTPQIVVNGQHETVGSDRAAVAALLDKAATEGLVAIALTTADGGRLRISAEAAPDAPAADLWLVNFENGRVVDIRKGENKGRQILYSNVVCGAWKVGSWTGTAVELTVLPSDLPGDKGASWAAILQEPGYRRILGAARLTPRP